MNLSIIIVNWNTKELLQKCIGSIVKLLNCSIVKKTEIVVVDNGSNDGSKEYLRSLVIPRSESRPRNPANASECKEDANARFFSASWRIQNDINIKVIENKENLGFAKANNQGIKMASGKYIMLLNSDTEVQEGALETLAGYLEKHTDVAAVSPMLLNTDGTPQLNYYMKFPNPWQILLYHTIILRPVAMHTPLRWLLVSKVGNDPFEVDQLPGAAVMVRKEILEGTRGLDENYSFLFEDVDWCYRVWKEGLGKLIVVSEAKIVHIGGASWKKRRDLDRYSFYKQYYSSLLLFIKKNYGKEAIFRFKLAMGFTFFANLLVNLLMLRKEKASAQAKLLCWILVK